MDKQLRFKKTLLAAKNALDQTNTRFFLASGTALGAWRDGKFIEHDGDIDLGVFATEFDPKIKERGILQNGYQIKFAHDQFHVPLDIFAYYEENEYMWYATHFGRICRCMARGFCRWKFQKFDLQPMDFLGATFLIPGPPEQYMIAKYGSDWKSPRNFNHAQGVSGLYQNRIHEFSLLRTVQWLLGGIQRRIHKSLQ